jgi:hypothetical protein
MITSIANARAGLKVGAWYSVIYGFTRIDFCVIDQRPGMVLLENPKWNLSDSEWMDVDELFGQHCDPIFLGYGKPRIFVGRIRKCTDCFGTLYTKPSL